MIKIQLLHDLRQMIAPLCLSKSFAYLSNQHVFSKQRLAYSQAGFLSRMCCYAWHMEVSGYHTDVRYPNILKKQTSSNNNGNAEAKNHLAQFLENLENVKNNGDFHKAIDLFYEFQKENPNWHEHWPSQKIAASALHFYYITGLNDVALSLHDALMKKGFQHGEGIYKTLIKCCLAKNDGKRALEYFECLKSKSLRDIRIYPELIKYFAEDGQLFTAHKLFEEMRLKELTQKTRKQLNDQAMLVSLVQACIRVSKEQKQPPDFSADILKNILDYLKERCLFLSQGLSHVISQWVGCQSEWMIQVIEPGAVKISDLSDDTNQPHEKYVDEFFTAVKSSFVNECQRDEMLKIEQFVEEKGPFKVVVDGANVMIGLETGCRNNRTLFQPGKLEQLLECIQFDKAVVVYPIQIEKRSNFSQSKEYKALMDSRQVEFFCAGSIPDDIVALLFALKSELIMKDPKRVVSLVTNDSFRDHIQLLRSKQWNFLRWIRHRQLRFSWNAGNNILVESIGVDFSNSRDTWVLQTESGQFVKVYQGILIS